MEKVITRGIILSVSDFAVLVELWRVRFSCTSVLTSVTKIRVRLSLSQSYEYLKPQHVSHIS